MAVDAPEVFAGVVPRWRSTLTVMGVPLSVPGRLVHGRRYLRGMLIVTGSILSRPDCIDQILALSLEHVRRSRDEPGCLLHSVHRDVEEPLRLVFLEHWADTDSLQAHFRVPASGAFVNEVATLAASPPELAIYDAQPVSV
jgi:quinol monooxygenase YgiN